MLCEEIIEFASMYSSAEPFILDLKTVKACAFDLGQIGELVRKIDPEYKEKNTIIPWKEIGGLRNRIIHNYRGFDLSILWDVIHNDIPDLLIKLTILIQQIG
jgi:uncharacterized protein with HEPN domain